MICTIDIGAVMLVTKVGVCCRLRREKMAPKGMAAGFEDENLKINLPEACSKNIFRSACGGTVVTRRGYYSPRFLPHAIKKFAPRAK